MCVAESETGASIAAEDGLNRHCILRRPSMLNDKAPEAATAHEALVARSQTPTAFSGGLLEALAVHCIDALMR